MTEAIATDSSYIKNCYGRECLVNLGETLNVDYVMSGSFDLLGNRIVISLKWIDVKNKSLHKSLVKEFYNNPNELQRMIQLMLYEMNDLPVNNELAKQLEYDNSLIIQGSVGKINNTGPRFGYAILNGDLKEFALRSTSNGGLDIFPGMTMIGAQFEKQYVGTEKFSAIAEFIINVNGMEQGLFIPSISLLNGFRFGNAGWEFAFGPSLSFRRISKGFFDTENSFGYGAGYYFSESDWNDYAYNNYYYSGDSTYFDEWGNFSVPSASEVSGQDYEYDNHYDTRGYLSVNTSWIFGFGRTFKSGNLNIPVNVFYSALTSGGGSMYGLSVGFNSITQIERTKAPKEL